MYETFTEWRNEIRASEKALRLMKEAAQTPDTQIASCWRSDLNRAIMALETTIERAKDSYKAEKQ